MDHRVLDRISLAFAETIAAGLPSHPEWIDIARSNLDRWERRNADNEWLVRNYREWRALLERPVAEVCRILTDPGDEGQRWRKNSPFTGIISQSVVLDIKRRFWNEARGV